jgi:hypothetical protein
VRGRDEPIPPQERLYRWLQVCDVNGSEVLPHVVDLEGSSVDREKYLPNGPPAHQPGHPDHNGLAETCVAKLPRSSRCNDIDYEFFAVDWPEEDNAAHAEIRPGRTPTEERPDGDRPDGFKPKSKATKNALRSDLASAMTVVRAPVSPG